jgi:hypothetical protein
MNNFYIVAGPGRTGSTLITSLLSKNLKLPIFYDTSMTTSQPFVMQTHNPKLQLDPAITVIYADRKNLFDTVISSCIANYYCEWTAYTNTIKPPLYVDYEDFYNRYLWCKRWREAFLHYTKYDRIITIDFDKLIDNYDYLFTALHLNNAGLQPDIKKSPRDITAINNIEEVKMWFAQLENDIFLNSANITSFEWGFDVS